MAGLIRKLVDPVVGLGAEAYAHRKNKKEETLNAEGGQAGSGAYEEFYANPPPSEPAAVSESDEDDWHADELAEQQPQHSIVSCVPKGKAGGPASIDDIANAFISAYPATPTGCILPCPVIIPQKRPGNKTRGFVNAYAPVLEELGITEQVWMDFMASLEESIRVNPIFDVVNAAAVGAGLLGNFFPSPALKAATTAILAADITAQRIYQRSRYNDFLAQLNAKYFQPLGLFCLIMTYEPRSSTASEPFDVATAIAKSEKGADATGIKLKWKTLKGITGETRGEEQIPQAAELVFPSIDRPEGSDTGWWKRSTAFADNYMDHRAQAKYASQNPGTALAMQPQFESSYGSVGTSRLSALERHQRRMDAFHDGGVRAYGQQAKWQAKKRLPGHKDDAPPPPPPPANGRGQRLLRSGGGGGPINLLVNTASGGKLQGHDARPVNIVRRKLKPRMMYLMLTQMPTQEQIAVARANIEVE